MSSQNLAELEQAYARDSDKHALFKHKVQLRKDEDALENPERERQELKSKEDNAEADLRARLKEHAELKEALENLETQMHKLDDIYHDLCRQAKSRSFRQTF